MSSLRKRPHPMSLQCFGTYSVTLGRSLHLSEQLWQFHESQCIIYSIEGSEITMATALLHSRVLNKAGCSPSSPCFLQAYPLALSTLPPFLDPAKLGSSSASSNAPSVLAPKFKPNSAILCSLESSIP